MIKLLKSNLLFFTVLLFINFQYVFSLDTSNLVLKKYQNEIYFWKKLQIRERFIVYNDDNYK